MGSAKLAVITEEARSFSADRGPAGQVFSGNFASVRTTVRLLQAQGLEADLFIISSVYGLIPADHMIKRYDPDVRSLARSNLPVLVSRKLTEILRQYQEVVFMLSTPYAVLTANALREPAKANPANSRPRLFVVSGSSGADALISVLQTYASEVRVFQKPGVARITSQARAEILRSVLMPRG